MNALVISDIHLSDRARDAYRFRAMPQVADVIEKHDVNVLLILGDLTEAKDNHSAELVNDIVDLLYSFASLCQVIILKGNHDGTSDAVPFFKFVRRLPSVRWVNTPQTLDFGMGPCLFLPYTSNADADWEPFRNSPERWRWVFAHNTFAGARSEHDYALSGIPQRSVPGDCPIISGDIHTPQTAGRVTYVGAPYTVDFGDDYEPRALLLSDRRKEPVSIPLSGPQKRLVTVTSLQQLSDQSFNKGDIVKVRVAVPPAERERWAETSKAVRQRVVELGGVPFLVQPQLLSEEAVPEDRRAAPVVRRSDEQLVVDFARVAGVSTETVDFGLALVRGS